MPVVLHMENTGLHSVVLKRVDVQLLLEDGTELHPMDASEVIAEAQISMRSAYLGIPLIVPYLLSRREIREFNFELARDYRHKAFPAFLRVTPEDVPSARVFFFRVEKGLFRLLSRSPVLKIPVELEALKEGGHVESGRSLRFRLALD